MQKSNRRLRPYSSESFAFAARGYLERFPCTVARFDQVLRRKFMTKKQPVEEQWIKDAIDFGLRNGFLNDDLYAQGVFNSLSRKGLPPIQIRQKMQTKQIDKTRIDELVATIPQDKDAQKDVLLTFARRKRLGLFRAPTIAEKDWDKKDYDKLRRAGFSHDVVYWFLNEYRD